MLLVHKVGSWGCRRWFAVVGDGLQMEEWERRGECSEVVVYRGFVEKKEKERGDKGLGLEK